MKFKVKCCVGKKDKIKFFQTIENAEKEFDKFSNLQRKGEITVFLSENTVGEVYKVIKQKVIIN